MNLNITVAISFKQLIINHLCNILNFNCEIVNR